MSHLRNSIPMLRLIPVLLPVILAGCRQPATSESAATGQHDPPPPAAASHADATEAAATADAEREPGTDLPGAEAASDGAPNAPNAAQPPKTVVAYYFHRTMRCPTCLSIEDQARKAVQTGFVRELERGTVEWRAVNIDQNGNEHFEKDFELTASSLVIVEMKDEKIARWKNLGRVWELVGDGPAFRRYVETEVAGFLD